MNTGVGIFASLIMTLGSAVVWVVAQRGLNGTLPRQRWAGIRVPATMASDEAWRRAHLAAGPAMRLGGVWGVLLGLIALAVCLVSKVETGLILVGVAGGGMLAGVLVGSVIGIRAAQSGPR